LKSSNDLREQEYREARHEQQQGIQRDEKDDGKEGGQEERKENREEEPTVQARIGALFAIAFTIKMTRKFAGCDYKVCAPEALWWGTGGRAEFFREPTERWNWKLMMRTPDFIAKDDLAEAVAKLKAKGKGPAVAEVQLETIGEGHCVQMLHVGPYDREPKTVAQMKAFAKENGLALHGLHHEIYLSDPRRVAPERLRTILRQPVR